MAYISADGEAKILLDVSVLPLLAGWFIAALMSTKAKVQEEKQSYDENVDKILKSFGFDRSAARNRSRKNRLFVLTLEKPDPIDLYCMLFRETKLIMFKLESKLSLQRMNALSVVDSNHEQAGEEVYLNCIESQIELHENILLSLLKSVLQSLYITPNRYIDLYQKLTSCDEFEYERDIEYQKEFYKKLDETNTQVTQMINGWVDESVRDTLDVIEAKYSDYRLKEMQEYMKATELMIFNSIVTSVRLITKKEYRKAMLIRKDEFLKKFGITIDYAEAYFRVRD